MLDTLLANQRMTTINASFNIWYWIEVYGDMGYVKNESITTEYVYEHGNLITSYPN